MVGGMPREGGADLRSEAHFPGNCFLLPVSAVFTLGRLHWVLFQAGPCRLSEGSVRVTAAHMLANAHL